MSDGVIKFIGDSMEQVKVVHGILKIMKHNLSAVQDIANKWDRPMIEQKTKLMEKVEFKRTFKSMQASNFSKIKENGDQINLLLKETSNVLNGSAEWKCHVEFVSSVIVNGLMAAIMTSLEFC